METKKDPRKNVYRLSNLWFNLGLLLTLAAVTTAFEWRTLYEGPVVDFNDPSDGQVIDYIPPTIIDPPPKPKPILARPVEAKEDEVEEVDPGEIIIDFTDVKFPDPVEMDEPDDEKTDETVVWAEKMPEPTGGYEAFYKYISKNINYPPQAKRLGVEGTVYVQFVVDEKGEITAIEIARGIGAGCDKEVIRLMENAPKWNPGKQRAVPVKVRMIMPIKFQLQ
ncbi:MAG: energy transducer TonB [Candidatus Cyclobacteriaceae bacterium M2_1C_046]